MTRCLPKRSRKSTADSPSHGAIGVIRNQLAHTAGAINTTQLQRHFLKRKERYERNAHRNEVIIKSIARNLNVRGLMSFVCCSRGNAVMVRWVNNAMAFAMILAFLAVFAVKLRWARRVSI